MASIVVRRLVTPTEDEIHQAATVLHAAFLQLNDAFGHSLTGGNRELDLDNNSDIKSFTLGFTSPVYAREPSGAKSGLRDSDQQTSTPSPCGSVLDLIIRQPSIQCREEQRAAGWNALQTKFPPKLRKWWSDYFIPRCRAWREACLGEGTKLRSWHLQMLSPPSPKINARASPLLSLMPLNSKRRRTGQRCAWTRPTTQMSRFTGPVASLCAAPSTWLDQEEKLS
ncbi:hypothetical protein C8F04DRAFT_511440 [Mycena alexandri]|uniref:Uncharacterized protein n=1 Tax=Mycena alexandri TaxID=1745969 RepID=A0AAD6SZ78_9AGAR|nr:hypothetical protein C8F04DRAFT_511440 [Mycena alexandri]